MSTADAPDGSTADEAGEGANSSQGSTATSPESQEPTTTHLLTVVQRFARPRRGGNRPPSREFRHSRADMATDEEYFFDSKAAGIGVLPDRPQPEMTVSNICNTSFCQNSRISVCCSKAFILISIDVECSISSGDIPGCHTIIWLEPSLSAGHSQC